MNFNRAFFPIILFAALAATGCKSNSTSPSTGGDTTKTTNGYVNPNPGSTFLMQDSLVGFSFTADSSTYTVKDASGTTFSVVSGDTTRTWYRYESNGDVSMIPKPLSLSRSGWFILPFGSQSTVTSRDTLWDGTQYDTVITIASGEGTGTATVMAQPYNTKLIKLTVMNFNQGGGSDTTVTHWAYAPTIGYFVSQLDEASSTGGLSQDVHHTRLVAFNKK